MGCNCGSRTPKASLQPSSTGSWSLTMPDGTRTTYTSERAAKAANAKAGGRGLVRRVA